MGSQLRWLERTPDKREVDGSIPFEPTIQTPYDKYEDVCKNVWIQLRAVQGILNNFFETILDVCWEKIMKI